MSRDKTCAQLLCTFTRLYKHSQVNHFQPNYALSYVGGGRDGNYVADPELEPFLSMGGVYTYMWNTKKQICEREFRNSNMWLAPAIQVEFNFRAPVHLEFR